MAKIILFGAGRILEKTISYLRKDVEIVAIVDNDNKKWGTLYNNIEIISPDNICNHKYDVIIISNDNYCEEIRIQLKEKNIKRVLPIYSKRISRVQKKLMPCFFTYLGLIHIYFKNEYKEQQFFPKILGVFSNPYYFSRRNIWKSLEKNRKYIKGRCMDFGCGTMPYAKLFDTEEYIGVEIEGASSVKNVIYYDGKTIPFKDNYFNSILCSEVLEHVPNIDDILDELRRVLVDGGYIVVTVPFSYPEHCLPFDYRRYTSIGIQKLFETHGFTVVEKYKSGTFIETMSQLKGVYINEKLNGIGSKQYIKKIMIANNNILGILRNKILPKDNDLYLDNIIVLKK